MDHSMFRGLSMESMGGTRARCGVPFERADAAPRVGGPSYEVYPVKRSLMSLRDLVCNVPLFD